MDDTEIEFKPGDWVQYGEGKELYRVVEIRAFPHGAMVGIFDEPPSRHVDYIHPDNLKMVSRSPRLSYEERTRLVNEVLNKIMNSVEVLRGVGIAVDLVYLCEAITNDDGGHILLCSNDKLIRRMKRLFESNHPVWRFVEINTDDE